MAHATFSALRFEQRGQTLYTGFAPASALLEYTHIDRYNPALANDDPKQGYQREPEQGRLSRLAMNMVRKEGGGILPTAILLSSREPVDFTSDGNCHGSIVVDGDRPFEVVDGQTRLLGIKHGIEKRGQTDLLDFQMPFVLLDNVDKLMEMVQFKIVNGESKSVRTDLVNMILTQVAAAKGDDAIKESERWRVVATRAVEILNAESRGMWDDMIVLPNATAYPKAYIEADPALAHRRLTRATSFITSVKPVIDWMNEFHFADGDDIDTESRELARVLGEYWNAICDLIPNAFGDRSDYVIQKTPGVFALHMLLAKPILRDMYRARRPYTKDDFKIMLEPIAELSDSKFWHTAERRASTYGSMRGFSELAQVFRDSLA